MGKYNEELVKAGVLLAAEGLPRDRRARFLPPEDAAREQALRDQLPGS